MPFTFLPAQTFAASGTYGLIPVGSPFGRDGYQLRVLGSGWTGSLTLVENQAPDGATPVYVPIAYQNANTRLAVAANTPITANGTFIVPVRGYDVFAQYTHTAGAVTLAVSPASGLNRDEADDVGFSPGGAGTEERTVADKLREAQLSVKDFGAVGDGTTDDTLAIQRALDACDAAGGGVVFLPEGTYLVSHRRHPDTAAVAACLIVPNNTIVRGAGNSNTIVKLAVVANAVPAGCNPTWQLQVITNKNPFSLLTQKRNIAIEDITFDGNAVNQSYIPPDNAHQVYFGKVRGAWCKRVVSKNFYGTAAAPPGETMHFEASGSADVHYVDCEAYVDDGGNTASGFSANFSTGVEYVGCVSRNMVFGMGFTNYGCAMMRYVNCHAYSNGYAGFNTEISEHVSWTGCQSGGRGADTALGVIGDQANLGNQFGFKILGSSYVTITGCTSTYNQTSTGYGVYISPFSTGPINSTHITITGCIIAFNDIGVYIDNASQSPVLMPNSNIITGNLTSVFGGSGNTDSSLIRYSSAPVENYVATNGTSGLRWNVQGTTTAIAYRWQAEGVEVMRLTNAGALAIVDGITAPAAVSGLAHLYVDTADGDLKVRFGDGTIKTIVTDT